MGSQWTSKQYILKDLLVAQGRKVPAEIIGSIGVGEKPATVCLDEHGLIEDGGETGDVVTKPDLGMIRNMLDMIKESDVVGVVDVADEVKTQEKPKPIKFSKKNKFKSTLTTKKKPTVNTLATCVVKEGLRPKNAAHISDDKIKNIEHMKSESACQPIKLKKNRQERNVAIMSLLEKENLSPVTGDLPKENIEVKLVELKDIKPDQTVKKVDTQKSERNLVKIEQIVESPSSMFRKKVSSPDLNSNVSMFKKKCDVSFKSTDTVHIQTNKSYVPSTHAEEYYKKFKERNDIQTSVRLDIWERAEQRMKEIDSKRLSEAAENASQTQSEDGNEVIINNNSSGPEADSAKHDASPTFRPHDQGLDLVRLSQHRHKLNKECVVCLVLCKSKPTMESDL